MNQPLVREATTADGHNARFYGRLAKGLRSRRPSILERLHAAKTADEVQEVVGAFLTIDASADTRRKWHRLADRRMAQLRAQALVTR